MIINITKMIHLINIKMTHLINKGIPNKSGGTMVFYYKYFLIINYRLKYHGSQL